MHEMNSFDSLYDQIMSSYNMSTVDQNKNSASEYSLEDDSEDVINDKDVECIEDEDSETYELEDDFNDLEDLTDEDMLTEADDDPFAAPTEDAPMYEAPATDETPTETPDEATTETDDAKEDEPATKEESDAASYNIKLDLIISNISAALKTTINTAGSDLYDKIIIYGFEESIKVFVEDYLKKMVDGDIKINTIEKMDIISFAAPNIEQIVKKIIQNLAKK